MENGSSEILRRKFSLSRITDFAVISKKEYRAERYFDRKMLPRDPLFNSYCSY